jgi:hypothetical protein
MNFLRQIAHSISQAIIQRLRQWTKPDNHTLALSAALDLTLSWPKSTSVLHQSAIYPLL